MKSDRNIEQFFKQSGQSLPAGDKPNFLLLPQKFEDFAGIMIVIVKPGAAKLAIVVKVQAAQAFVQESDSS